MNEEGSDFDAGSDSDSGSGSSSGSGSGSGPHFDSTSNEPTSDSGASTAENRRDESDREWGRIPIDTDEYDSDSDSEGGSDDEPDPPEDDDPFAPEPSSTPIEPGEPTLENALFVVLGAVAMVLVLFQLVSLGIGG
ncbi:DUF7312 domain-containing protein [Halomontanus rarus]|uniref:DUF7312 domain-containing protein n=1 Tax=Halomontanus rarus TaxID=3034020 RepID=UPI001A982DCD